MRFRKKGRLGYSDSNETNVYACVCFERVIYSAQGGCGGSDSVGWPP